MNRYRFKKRESGFTLIEILVVLAILGILVMIAAPTYQDSVRKSRRSDGMQDLMELSARQERFYAQNSTYTTDLNTAAGLNLDRDLVAGLVPSSERHYTLAAAAGGTGSITTSYVLTATPVGAQADDTGCLILGMNSLGQRGATGTLGVDCW